MVFHHYLSGHTRLSVCVGMIFNQKWTIFVSFIFGPTVLRFICFLSIIKMFVKIDSMYVMSIRVVDFSSRGTKLE
jgi:hypothetical protein